MAIIRKPQRFWYLKSWDTIIWTSLYIELCCLWVIFLFTIPEIYHDDTLGAFLWGDMDHDQWSKITHMVHQRNRWIWDQRIYQFLWCTSDLASLILIRISQRKAPSISIELSVKKKKKKNLQVKLLILLGQKLFAMLIILLVFWYCYASIFFSPNYSICNPIATYLNLIFLCFFIKNMTLWYFTCIYLAIIEWHRVGYEEFCRSRRVLSTEAEGRGV